jgi:hypothetical protein
MQRQQNKPVEHRDSITDQEDFNILAIPFAAALLFLGAPGPPPEQVIRTEGKTLACSFRFRSLGEHRIRDKVLEAIESRKSKDMTVLHPDKGLGKATEIKT